MKTLFIMFQREPWRRLFSGRNRFIALLPFFSLFSCVLTAQDEANDGMPILFRGAVVDAVTENPVEGVLYYSDRPSVTHADGLFSFYAHVNDTVVFEKKGYRSFLFLVSDSLRAREYTVGIFLNPDTIYISEVVIIPSLGNLRSLVMSETPVKSAEQINAANNLRLSAYQSIAGMNELGNPDANYQVLMQRQKIDAYEKGGIPSDNMVALNPLIIIPIVYTLAKGLPHTPEPPTPYISSKELKEILKSRRSLSDTIR